MHTDIKPIKLPETSSDDISDSKLDTYGYNFIERFFYNLQKKYLPSPKCYEVADVDHLLASYDTIHVDIRKNNPIKYFLLYDIDDYIRKISYRLNDIKYWFLYRIHPKYRAYWNIKTDLKPGYYDADTLIEEYIIKIFIDFFEFSTGEHSHTDWDNVPEFQTLKEIYQWFKYDKKDVEKAIDVLYDNYEKNDYIKINELEDHKEKKDTEMFIKLIENRKCLWD